MSPLQRLVHFTGRLLQSVVRLWRSTFSPKNLSLNLSRGVADGTAVGYRAGLEISSKQHTPELAELEAKFYADDDPERVWNRQFSNSIRSGRG